MFFGFSFFLSPLTLYGAFGERESNKKIDYTERFS